jgi:hypothetical protein
MAAGVLNAGPTGFGILYAAMGAGALTAALTVAMLTRPRLRVLVGGGVVLGVSELVLSATTSFPVAATAVYFAGLGAIATAISANTLVQITVPGPLRGRVMSVYTTVFAGSTPIGNGLTGGLGGLMGTPAALVMNGAVTIAAEAIAAVAVLRGRVPRIGDPAGAGGGGRRSDGSAGGAATIRPATSDATVATLD